MYNQRWTWIKIFRVKMVKNDNDDKNNFQRWNMQHFLKKANTYVNGIIKMIRMKHKKRATRIANDAFCCRSLLILPLPRRIVLYILIMSRNHHQRMPLSKCKKRREDNFIQSKKSGWRIFGKKHQQEHHQQQQQSPIKIY